VPKNDAQFANFFLDPTLARIVNAAFAGAVAIPTPPRTDLLPVVTYAPPIAAAGTLVTNPLTAPAIYYAAYHLGAWATGTSTTAAVSWVDPVSILAGLGSIGLPLFAGLAITAIVAAIGSYLLISRVWIWHVAAKRRGARP